MMIIQGEKLLSYGWNSFGRWKFPIRIRMTLGIDVIRLTYDGPTTVRIKQSPRANNLLNRLLARTPIVNLVYRLDAQPGGSGANLRLPKRSSKLSIKNARR